MSNQLKKKIIYLKSETKTMGYCVFNKDNGLISSIYLKVIRSYNK